MPTDVTDAGADVAMGSDEGGATLDGGSDGREPMMCDPTPSTDPADPFCFIAGPCPTCAKAGADTVRYLCSTRIAGGFIGQPLTRKSVGDGGDEPLANCNRLKFDMDAGLAEYCCPAGCVEQTPQDNDAGNVFCPSNQPRSFVCPANAKGESIIPTPPGCSARPAVEGSSPAAICCR